MWLVGIRIRKFWVRILLKGGLFSFSSCGSVERLKTIGLITFEFQFSLKTTGLSTWKYQLGINELALPVHPCPVMEKQLRPDLPPNQLCPTRFVAMKAMKREKARPWIKNAWRDIDSYEGGKIWSQTLKQTSVFRRNFSDIWDLCREKHYCNAS